jgi:hypothetical protein
VAFEFARLPVNGVVKQAYAERSGITVQGSTETHFRYDLAGPQAVSGLESCTSRRRLSTAMPIVRDSRPDTDRDRFAPQHSRPDTAIFKT